MAGSVTDPAEKPRRRRGRLASLVAVRLPTAMSEVVPSAGSGGPVDLIAEATAHFSTRPSWDEYFMATAVLISTRSPCERLHVGCVIVSGGDRRNRLVAAGYNGFLPGTPHASRVRDGHEQATVHAEQNCLADCAKRGVRSSGCVAYVTHYPCIICTRILLAAGIQEIRYIHEYKNDPLVPYLAEKMGVLLKKI